MKVNHMVLCAVLIVAGVGLLASGAGSLAFVPLLACMVMMGAMMYFMMGGNSRNGEK